LIGQQSQLLIEHRCSQPPGTGGRGLGQRIGAVELHEPLEQFDLAAALLARLGVGHAARPLAPGPLPAPEQPRSEPQRQLQQTLSTAEDLFNRGENDLACEQVQRAQLLRRRLAAPPPAVSDDLLERFSRACPTL